MRDTAFRALLARAEKAERERDEALRRRDAWKARAENHVEIVNALRAKTKGQNSRTLSKVLLGAAFAEAEARAEKAEAERDKARALAAARTEAAAELHARLWAEGCTSERCREAIRALARPEETAALAKIRAEAYVRGWNDAKPDAPFDLTKTWDAEEIAYRLAAIREAD
jgi:colicin import membrane protein